MVSGAKLREESMHRRAEAWERERAAAREARLREQIANNEKAAKRNAVHNLAEEDFKQMKGRVMTEDTEIDFIDPKDFKLASVVSERAGRTYYADGSYSVQLGEADYYHKEKLHKLYLPNGVRDYLIAIITRRNCYVKNYRTEVLKNIKEMLRLNIGKMKMAII